MAAAKDCADVGCPAKLADWQRRKTDGLRGRGVVGGGRPVRCAAVRPERRACR